VIAGLLILIYETAPRLQKLPFWAKVVHFAFWGVLLATGVGGLRCLIYCCVNPGVFFRTFAHGNVFGIEPRLMVFWAMLFSVVALPFCVSVISMGKFSRRGRNVFQYLVIPYCSSYPVIMISILDFNYWFGSLAARIGLITAIIMAAVSILSVAFYRSQIMNCVFDSGVPSVRTGDGSARGIAAEV
jgi:hypothetical protein